MDKDAALKRACFWLYTLIEGFGVDPKDTELKVSVDGEPVQVIRLADDLRQFEALGVTLPDWSGWEIEETQK